MKDHIIAYNDLSVSINTDMKDRRYQYLVSSGAYNHIGFENKPDLLNWIIHRGLILDQLPSEQDRCVPIIGMYIDHCHGDIDQFISIEPIGFTTVLDNGRLKSGKITQEEPGRVIHFLNCNLLNIDK